MAHVRADQAPARSEIGLAAVCTLTAILILQVIAAPGSALAAEAADAAGIPQKQPSLLLTPVATDAPAVNAVSGSPSPSRWARLPRWQKVFGVGAILTGLAAVGSGAYLLWLNGQPTCGLAACASSYHTALAGWLLMAGGTAASLGGVTLVLVPPMGEAGNHAAAGLALYATY